MKLSRSFSYYDYTLLALEILRPQAIPVTFGIAAGVSCSLFGSLVHHYVAQIFYMNIESPQFVSFLLTAAALNLLSGLASMLRGHMFTRINQALYTATYRRFLTNVCSASMRSWDTDYSPEELSKTALSDLSEVIGTSTMLVNVTTRTTATVIACAWILKDISNELNFLCFLVCVTQVATIHYSYKAFSVFSDASRQVQNEQEANANQYIQNHVQLQLYSMQPVYLDIFESHAQEHARRAAAEANAYTRVIFFNHVVPRSLELCFDYCIFYLGHHARASEIISYYAITVDALNGLKDVLSTFIRTKDSAIRVRKHLTPPSSTYLMHSTDPKDLADLLIPSTPPRITFQNVTFAYPATSGAKPIFDDFSLDIRPYEKLAIVARSGTGKTTLMKLLLNMYPLNGGSIYIDDTDIQTIPVQRLRALISVVPQEPIFFPQKTLRENILLSSASAGLSSASSSASSSTKDLPAILSRAQLHDFVDRLDDKLTALSGGQKQRLAIARVLATDAPIVIFDEPTSALDDENTRLVMQEITRHCHDKTVLFITHNRSLIQAGSMRVLEL